jgi:hypothetical protein
MVALNEDRALLARFIEWVVPAPPRMRSLEVIEQSWPHKREPADFEIEDRNEDRARKGLPDGCVHNDEGWALLIESKIAAPLTLDQLGRHKQSARDNGLDNVTLLALTARDPSHLDIEGLVSKNWSELYKWLKQQATISKWAKCVIDYMEVAEAKLSNAGYLKEGTLTVFTGIDFGSKKPYNYLQAKRQLTLAMAELRKLPELKENLDIDLTKDGRGKITGKDSTLVWDFLWLESAKNASSFTEFPHLTLGIHEKYLHAVVIVPNGMRSSFRNSLLDGGIAAFRATFQSMLDGLNDKLNDVEGAFPSVEVVQRRSTLHRSKPFIDAKLEFDLRTAFDGLPDETHSPKHQPQWLDVVFHALSNKKSNLQLAVGAKFMYESCPDANTPKILKHIANAWIACKPLIDKMNVWPPTATPVSAFRPPKAPN